MSNRNDELLFTNDELPQEISSPTHENENNWKVLIVDDDPEVHSVTKLTLRRLIFEGKGITFLSAYSAAEAKALLAKHPDTAVVLLDVVMEEDAAGLKLARYIRTEIANKLVRIILRTGQPGQAPEHTVITDYDINDYKEKTELTAGKLYTTLITALRSFRDLTIIESNRCGLEKIIEASASIFELQSMTKFASGVLFQLVALLHLNPNALYCHTSGFAATRNPEADAFQVLAATGQYEQLIGSKLIHAAPQKIWQDVAEALSRKTSIYYPDRFIIYFCSKHGSENFIYMDGLKDLRNWDRDLLEVFCTNVSIAFDNIHLNKEVEDTQKEIIYTLGEIAEARSSETGHHVKRVAELSKLLGLCYGLSPEEADLLRLASPTHDIGKLGIPDSILNKPGKLTPEEFEIMKNHAVIGHNMLKNSRRPILRNGALIALQHHERYDGRGYPHKLKGTEIHLYGRIVALADVFDALGSNRVYKKSWTLPEIMDYIKDERGGHFDPILVDILIQNLDDVVKIRKKFPDD